MRDAVNVFTEANEKLFTSFGCAGRYFIKPVTEGAWRVDDSGDMPILTYKNNGAKQHAVIVRQDGRPLIYRKGGYAMVIAIDCVKIAFVLDEKQELKS